MNLLDAHRALDSAHLVVSTQGNASIRLDSTRMLIKASGVSCKNATFVDVRLLDGRHGLAIKPSTDADTHRFIYNHCPDINAIVHTHSTFATAFAAAERFIPCILTAQADEFGGRIPLAPACNIGDDSIGKQVVDAYAIGYHAVLIAKHGVFTVGRTLEAAVKAAIMVEDCAKTAWHAVQLRGYVAELPTHEIAAHYARYMTDYGQGAAKALEKLGGG